MGCVPVTEGDDRRYNIAEDLAAVLHCTKGGLGLGVGDRFGLTEEIECVSAEVLFVGPLDATEESFDLAEISRVFEFGEDTFFEVGGDIEKTNFFVVKGQFESIVFKGLDVENVGRSCLGEHDWILGC